MPQINFYVCGAEGCFFSLAWIQSHRVGTSQCVIIRSGFQTAHQFNQLIFREVTSALCLCLFKDKRKEALGLLLFPRFHLAGEEQGRPVARHSWITSKPACSGNAAADLQWTGEASVTLENIYNMATWEIFLTVAKHFTWKKFASAIICLTFNREILTIYKWRTFSLKQYFPPYSHFPFKRS